MDTEVASFRIEKFCKANKGIFKKDRVFSVCRAGNIEISLNNESGNITIEPVTFSMTNATEIDSVWKDNDFRDIQIKAPNSICRLGSRRGTMSVHVDCIEQPEWLKRD